MSDVELDFNSVFPTLPKAILTKLEASYNEIKRNFRERRYEPSELNGAKFSEAVYRVLEWHTLKTFTAFGTKIRDFSQALRKFESMSSFPDSIRFHIPKLLDVLYGVRNKRGVGHLSNEIDPNHMDSIMVVSASDWVMAELVRVLHGTSTEEAQALIEALVTKKIPIVWSVGEVKRVLNTQLSYRDKVLVLLYDSYPNSVLDTELFRWVEHSTLTYFRRDVLRPCHKDKLIEYDQGKGKVVLSPLGLDHVEKNIKLEF